MAVVQLYFHLAPKSEVHIVVKALIRLLRSHNEVQVVVLTSIAAMSTERQVISLRFLYIYIKLVPLTFVLLESV